ncbi:MAG: hypothetical protein AABX74_06485 [Nanoarchaeota archaeon]
MPQLLEQICKEVDQQLLQNPNPNIDDILDKLGMDGSVSKTDIRDFASEYLKLAVNYKNKREILAGPNINFKRMGQNALIFSFIGAALHSNYPIFDPVYYTSAVHDPLAIMGFLGGAALTYYDEIKRKGISIFKIGTGILVGGFLGMLADFLAGPESNLFGYIGAGIGGLAGYLRKNPGEDFSKKIMYEAQQLDKRYNEQKKELIKFYNIWIVPTR